MSCLVYVRGRQRTYKNFIHAECERVCLIKMDIPCRSLSCTSIYTFNGLWRLRCCCFWLGKNLQVCLPDTGSRQTLLSNFLFSLNQSAEPCTSTSASTKARKTKNTELRQRKRMSGYKKVGVQFVYKGICHFVHGSRIGRSSSKSSGEERD